MIQQVSVQASSMPETPASHANSASYTEAAGGESNWIRAGKRKARASPFAKLLEGLTKKLNIQNNQKGQGMAGGADSVEAEGVPGLTLGPNSRKNTSKTGLAAQAKSSDKAAGRAAGKAAGRAAGRAGTGIGLAEEDPAGAIALMAGMAETKAAADELRAGLFPRGLADGVYDGVNDGVNDGGLAGEAWEFPPERNGGHGKYGREDRVLGASNGYNPASVQGLADSLPRKSWETVLTENRLSGRQDRGLVDVDRELKESVKGKDRRKEKAQGVFNLEVQDNRAPAETGAAFSSKMEKNEKAFASEAEITVELRHSRGKPDDSGGRETASGSASFKDMLARELREGLNTDIVRQASLILRDGGEGLIRLSLKPESLGLVKIRLEMSENKIAGHIIVESDEALRAFEQEIRSLEQSFRDSGFDGASIDMSLSQNSGQNGAFEQNKGGIPFVNGRLASNYDGFTDFEEEKGIAMTVQGMDVTVNMLV